ncbi:hypothetical protein VB776_21830 [Arcicella sp. DC2W]|uniref:Uncharacterized protein n=1 Tax=Arcicella gelida TaxID=2984195 RepID=A0ABU5SAT0_9BACT|nr:hypothetical protein [Arcicella sp. DC2W]MEA5405595.1 hypothetical protein [Arcicella sp. DC2W]
MKSNISQMLKKMNFFKDVPPKKIKISVIGPTASGKTALLYSIFNEFIVRSELYSQLTLKTKVEEKSSDFNKSVMSSNNLTPLDSNEEAAQARSKAAPSTSGSSKSIYEFLTQMQLEFVRNRFRPTKDLDDTESYMGIIEKGKNEIPIEILNLSGSFFNIDDNNEIQEERLEELIKKIKDSTIVIICYPIAYDDTNKIFSIDKQILKEEQKVFNHLILTRLNKEIPRLRVITKFDTVLKQLLTREGNDNLSISEKFREFLESSETEMNNYHHRNSQIHNIECIKIINELLNDDSCKHSITLGDSINSNQKRYERKIMISGINRLDGGLMWDGGEYKEKGPEEKDNKNKLNTLNYFPGVKIILDWLLFHSGLLDEKELGVGYREDENLMTMRDFITWIKESK